MDKYVQGKNFNETSRELGSRTVQSQGLSSSITKLEKLITFVPRTKTCSNPSKLSYGDSILLETIVEAAGTT